MLGPTEIVELRGNGSILLIGRRLSFGQLNRFDAKTCGSIEDPQTIAERIRCYSAYPGNSLKLRHFWTAATPGSRMPANDQLLAGDMGRIVAQGTWMVLEIADERNLGPSIPEKMKGRITPVLSTLKGRPVATMSLDEKFQLTFEKVPDYLGDSLAALYRARVSPAAIGTAIATLAVLSIISDGVIAAALVAIGYAMVGADIFSIIGDLVMAVSLVANAHDEGEIDRAAKIFAKVAVEISLNVLITLLTLGAGRVGAKLGKAGRSKENLYKKPPNYNSKISHEGESKYSSHEEATEKNGRVERPSPSHRLGRPNGMPGDWIEKPSKKGGGITYVNPSNVHDRVRIMPGSPKSPNLSQKFPYVKRQKDGKFYDLEGRIAPGDSAEAHIPLDKFIFR